MRGDSKNKLIFFLCGILMLAMLSCNTSYVKAEEKRQNKTILILGDSIPYGMSLGKKSYTGVDEAEKVYWLTEGGINITSIQPDFKINLGKTMPKAVVNTLTNSKKVNLLKEVEEKKIEDIVVIIGANWPGEKSAKLIVEYLKKLVKETSCRIYYVNILPYVNKGFYKDRTQVLNTHNKVTKEGFEGTGIRYIDANSLTKTINNYQNLTWDGVHYSKKVYNVIFKEILSIIEERKKENQSIDKKHSGKKEKIEKSDAKSEKKKGKAKKKKEKPEVTDEEQDEETEEA